MLLNSIWNEIFIKVLSTRTNFYCSTAATRINLETIATAAKSILALCSSKSVETLVVFLNSSQKNKGSAGCRASSFEIERHRFKLRF